MASTLTDIGQHAGCSTSTVSRVLNNSGPVSDGVRLRVESAVRKHGYIHRPSGRAVALQKLRCDNAVILVYRPGHVESLHETNVGQRFNSPLGGSPLEPIGGSPLEIDEDEILSSSNQLSHGFYHLVMDGLVKECRHWEINTQLETCSHLDMTSLATIPAFSGRSNGDAATSILFVGPYRPEVAAFAAECTTPMVLVGVNVESRHDTITIDNYGGIRQAVTHLAQLGHRDIGFVGVDGLPDFKERQFAFTTYMQELGLPIRDAWVNLGSVRMAEITERTAAMLSRPERPTALVCGNDLTAMSTIQAAHQCGIRVPDELSIVGFDDIPVATLTAPALTTVHVPMQQIGRQAVRQMVIRDSCSDQETHRGCVTRVATELVVRQSTARPAKI